MTGSLEIIMSGAGKSHHQDNFIRIFDCLRLPQAKWVGGESPVVACTGNYSKMCMHSASHGQVLAAPDEVQKWIQKKTGQGVKGTLGTQMIEFAEMLDFLTPSMRGGGTRGVQANRAFVNHNGMVSSIQLKMIPDYISEDGSGTTFRLLKSVVPEHRVLEDRVDQTTEAADTLLSRKYTAIDDQMWEGAEAVVLESVYEKETYLLEQILWRAAKRALRASGQPDCVIKSFVLKFRDVSERLAHHVMVERLVAATEVLLLHSFFVC